MMCLENWHAASVASAPAASSLGSAHRSLKAAPTFEIAFGSVTCPPPNACWSPNVPEMQKYQLNISTGL
jgi:hypothetical protein